MQIKPKIEANILYNNKVKSFLSYYSKHKNNNMSCSTKTCNTKTCNSNCCDDQSQTISPYEGEQIGAKEYLKYVETQKQIRNEQRQAAKKALRVKLKNKRNTRVGHSNSKIHLDSSGNDIQMQVSRRAFIMEHLAKVQLAKALGMEDKVPSIMSIIEKHNRSQPTKVHPSASK